MIPPLDSERQARELPQVRAVYAAFDRDPGAGKMAPHNRALLGEALSAAQVELGAYDCRIAAWLAGWEPMIVAVVAGWAARAYEAGREAAAAQTAAPGPDAPVMNVLRAAADALAVDLAVWEARDPADPSPEARQARRSAIAAADAVLNSVSRLRDRLEGGPR